MVSAGINAAIQEV